MLLCSLSTPPFLDKHPTRLLVCCVAVILSVLCRMEQLTLLKSFGLSCAVAGAVCVELIKPAHGAKSSSNDGVSATDFAVGNIVVVLQVRAALVLTPREVLPVNALLIDLPAVRLCVWRHLLQCLGMASLLVAQKSVLSRYHPTVVVMWYYSLGSLITLVVCLAKATPLQAYQLSTHLKPWLALGYAALFGTAFNYNVRLRGGQRSHGCWAS